MPALDDDSDDCNLSEGNFQSNVGPSGNNVRATDVIGGASKANTDFQPDSGMQSPEPKRYGRNSSLYQSQGTGSKLIGGDKEDHMKVPDRMDPARMSGSTAAQTLKDGSSDRGSIRATHQLPLIEEAKEPHGPGDLNKLR